MNKLKSFFELNIPFVIENCPDETDLKNKKLVIYWQVGESDTGNFTASFSNSFEDVVENLWQAAKKHYPDAECFKEEREEG